MGVHVNDRGRLTKIDDKNVGILNVERRKYWCGEVPMDILKLQMRTDVHYQKNYPAGTPACKFESLEYPVSLEPTKEDQTFGDG